MNTITRTFALATIILATRTPTFSQGTFCDPLGNVAIFSNYDGGALTINVDVNIPNLKIGVVSYEYSRITLIGTCAANVTALWYLGYDADNNHCSLPAPWVTSISGAPAGTDSIILYPPATYANVNGYGSIICNYSCDVNTNQGGCNTADQIAHWFLTNWGGSLLFHFTQYGCWGNGYTISGGGNCCANPVATTIDEGALDQAIDFRQEEGSLVFETPLPVDLLDASGRMLGGSSGTLVDRIDLGVLSAGPYIVRDHGSGRAARFVLLR